MQDGREPKSDDVDIERHESSETIRKPVDPEQQLDEVARTPGDKVGDGGQERSAKERNGGADEAAPTDPEEAQSPT